MKAGREKISILSGLSALILVCLIPLTAEAAEKLEKVRIAYPSVTMSIAPAWIAKEAGFFREEGLDVEMPYISSGTTIVQALLGGDVHAGVNIGPPPVITAIARGAGLTMIAITGNRLDYVLVSRQPIRDPSELAGKRFAVSSLGAISEVVTRLALEKLGVNPNSVTMLAVGGSPLRIGALAKGHVDVAILSLSEIPGTEDLGFYTVLDLAKSDIEYPYNALVVSKRFAAEKKSANLGMIRGIVKGLRFMRDNRDESVKIASRWLKTQDTDILRRQWQIVAFTIWQEVPYPTEAGFGLLIKGLVGRSPEVAKLRMADVYDTSFLDELSRTGFFKTK